MSRGAQSFLDAALHLPARLIGEAIRQALAHADQVWIDLLKRVVIVGDVAASEHWTGRRTHRVWVYYQPATKMLSIIELPLVVDDCWVDVSLTFDEAAVVSDWLLENT